MEIPSDSGTSPLLFGDELSLRLENVLRDWFAFRKTVDSEELGAAPGKGDLRQVEVVRLREIYKQYKEFQEMFREMLNRVQGHQVKVVQDAICECKFKLHQVGLSLEGMEMKFGSFASSFAGSAEVNSGSKFSSSTLGSVAGEGFSAVELIRRGDTPLDEFRIQQTSSNRRVSIPKLLELEFFEAKSDSLENYEFIKTIRSSLQGEIKLFTRKDNKEKVAIKVCRKELIEKGLSSNGRNVLEDVRNEASIMDFLNFPGHRNVLRIITSFEDSEFFYLVLEYAGRGEFFDIVSQAGRLDEEIARYYFKQLAEAVYYFHTRGVCHLDLSLENLLMDEEGTLKVCDFGLARQFNPEEFFESSSGNKPGKPQYMSPEIYAGSPFRGDKSDSFSLGVILFVMLAGFPPFDLPTQSDMRFFYIMNNKLHRLLSRWKLSNVISSTVTDLLNHLLCPEPSRFSLDQVLSHLWLTNS